MKLSEALKNWKKDPDMAVVAIQTLREKELYGPRLKDFIHRHCDISEQQLNVLLSKTEP